MKIPAIARKIGRKIYWKLEKLNILSYSSEKRNGPYTKYEVMFNPDSYSLTYENSYAKHQGINTSGRQAKFELSRPADLSLKLIFDGTGATEYSIPLADGYFGLNTNDTIPKPEWVESQTVSQRIRRFLELTAMMDGVLHEPRFLTLEWGTLVFKCRLKSVKINYTLFDKGGDPLRAELDAVFIGETDEDERLKRENKSSPDLTHKRIVRANDTLPLLCHEIYGSGHYYLEIARVNKLVDFRNLVPGQELYFPPIEN